MGTLFLNAQPESGPSKQSGVSIAELQRLFREPPDDARIMMRWWWFGPAVNKPELEREMKMMKQGGIGGFEVQPVYPLALDDPQHNFRNLSYLSDEFLDSLHFVSDKAKELGLRMDLTLGSGWPYGGPQVPITEAAGSLRVIRVKVDSSSRSVALPNLVAGEELLAAFIAPSSDRQSEREFRELSEVREGRLLLPSGPAETDEVLFFIASRTGMQVKRAAVGAEGFVLDHYDKAAVDHYLQHVGDRLMQAFPSDRPYAVFCDSLEVYGSDWTGDFLQQFQRRRGYDLHPHLPALAGDAGAKTEDIRHDWGETLTELFNERFASTVHEWARRNRTKFRMQGYGVPPAELSSSALADLPEGEGAQWQSLSATRWASSASHIYGRPVTSSETWTWLHSPVFRATPLDMKAEADRHFLEGINQLIGHGWPYSAENVEYPGWRFYAAAVFDEKNPWWIVMPDVTAYLQRVSYMLRQGQPANDVALYLPNDDAWARFRPGHVNLFQTLQEQIGPGIVPGILQSGFNLDFFDEDALRRVGRIEGNTLALGGNHYRIVVLPNAQRISPETYRKFEQFVRAGGTLIATGQLPGAAPGFLATEADNAQIREITQRLFPDASAGTRFVPDEAKIGGPLSKALAPDVLLSPAAPEIGFVHRKLPEAEIYFLANTANTRQTTDATFRVTGLQPEWWDPMTGKIVAAPVKERTSAGTTVPLELEPYASRFLVFSRRNSSAPAHGFSSSTALDISRNWRVTFGKGARTETMDQLRSWTDNEDTRYFSGQASYEKTVTVPADMLHAGNSVHLDFGEGHPLPPQPLKAGMQAWLETPIREVAVVYVNGNLAGSLWCPPYSLDVTALLHAGENAIRIDVANLALNYMAGRRLPDYRLLDLRYGVRFEAQEMDKVQPVPAGLFGPIRLISIADAQKRGAGAALPGQAR
ncbi:MAG TPA: glycosyl hydrolase [Terriglobales bacterium]